MTTHTPVLSADPFGRYRAELALGSHWYLAALRAAGEWTLPSEVVQGRKLTYLIDGQALDLLLVIERVVASGGGAAAGELARLLFDSEPPIQVVESQFYDALGDINSKTYLNYFYGITVEEALLSAVELEAAKTGPLDASASQELYDRVYGRPLPELLADHAMARGASAPKRLAWPEYKFFTYWLFRYRVRTHVPPRIASDTRKALDYLRSVRGASGGSPDPLRPASAALPDGDESSGVVLDIWQPAQI